MSEINVWDVVAYLFGVFGIVMGLISAILRPLVGLPLIIAGLVLLPPTRTRIESRTDSELTDWTAIGLYCSLFAVGILFFYMF